MRLDEARSLDIGGSGLGLAIARSIMTALGGSIVAAAVDNGAEFRATFPAPAAPRHVSFGSLALVVAAGLARSAAGVVPSSRSTGDRRRDRRRSRDRQRADSTGSITSDPLLVGLAAIGFALLMFIVGTHLPVRDRRLRSALGRGAAVAATVGVAGCGCGGVARLIGRLASTGDPRGAVGDEFGRGCASGAAGPRLVRQTRARRHGVDRDRRCRHGSCVARGAGHRPCCPRRPGRSSRRSRRDAMFVAARGCHAIDRGYVGCGRCLTSEAGVSTCGSRCSRCSRVRGSPTEFGTSILIAGFAVGAVVALLGEPRRVAQQLVGSGEGFAIPLFFVHLGAQIDLGALFRSPRALALAGVARRRSAIAIHVAAAVVWRLPVSTRTGGLGTTRSAGRCRVDRSRHKAAHRRAGRGGDGCIAVYLGGLCCGWCAARQEAVDRRERARHCYVVVRRSASTSVASTSMVLPSR